MTQQNQEVRAATTSCGPIVSNLYSALYSKSALAAAAANMPNSYFAAAAGAAGHQAVHAAAAAAAAAAYGNPTSGSNQAAALDHLRRPVPVIF